MFDPLHCSTISSGCNALYVFVFIQYLAGLAVTEACREVMGPTGEQVRLKWPNDIYALESGDRVERCLSKLGGVLVNTNVSGNEADIVLGMQLS